MKNLNNKFSKIEEYKDELMSTDYNISDTTAIDRFQKISIIKMIEGRDWENAWYYGEYPVIKTVKLFKKIK